jgi:UDP-4-amino-4,6-dideoxy-N-acetyl-beta-L-altrosamine transaminase
MIPYGRQEVTDADIEAVLRVLRSDFLTQGPEVPRFEEALAAYVGAPHCVASSSATAALHLACLALGLGPGDWLWTSPITFVASANCARYCGANVDLVDIDPATCNIAIPALRSKLLRAGQLGRLPKVLVPVHLAGHPCELDEIGALAKEFGFRVLEDASHAIGARYRDRMIGCGEHSDITVFSFHPVKIITTGEGGAATTRDSELAARMANLRTHGITRDPATMSRAPDGPWYYEQVALGFNYRLTDLQAALGRSQLARIEEYLARRHQIAALYDRLLSDAPVRLPVELPHVRSSLHLYVVRLADGAPPHRTVFERMRARGIGVNLHYIPIYRHAFHAGSGLSAGDFPESERYYASAITLPIFPSLADAQVHEVVEALREACVA